MTMTVTGIYSNVTNCVILVSIATMSFRFVKYGKGTAKKSTHKEAKKSTNKEAKKHTNNIH
mgnify:CR=1 FL=1